MVSNYKGSITLLQNTDIIICRLIKFLIYNISKSFYELCDFILECEKTWNNLYFFVCLFSMYCPGMEKLFELNKENLAYFLFYFLT